MRTISELIAEVPAFQGLSPERLELIAGCGQNRSFEAGEMLMTAADTANVFYIIRHGTVALELFVPERGPLVVETLDDGDLLGWSWLFPPYRVEFDARAMDTVRTIAFDGACLRGKCEADPALGYDMMKRFAAVITARLQATRMRLIDVYGHVAGG